MLSSALTWFKALSTAGKTGVITASFIGLSAVSAVTSDTQRAVNTTTPGKQDTSKQVLNDPVVTHKTVTTTESVAFEATTTEDSTLTKDTIKITTEGVNGLRTRTYDVTYKDGKEDSRSETSNKITTEPINQVTSIGTYVYVAPQPTCTNGSYVNSAGNTVCSPSESSVGASAKCADGTYSYSQSRRGTCSSHGGVSVWY